MSLPLVSLCGHTWSKTLNLVKLYLAARPETEHELALTFNGGPISFWEIADFLEDRTSAYRLPIHPLRVINDPLGRDIAMHIAALKNLDWTPPWAFCLNDDVQAIKPGWFEEAAELIVDHEIVGAQPNFMAIFPLEHVAKVRKKSIENVQEFAKLHGRLRMLRTHAFAVRTPVFRELWEESGHNCRKFEPITITRKHVFLKDPETIYDSDYQQFMDGESPF